MILLKNRDRNPSFKKGEYVEINDAGNYPMELSVDGVCKQETTTGKQLLDYDNLTNIGQLTKINPYGFRITGTKAWTYGNFTIDLKANTKYTFKCLFNQIDEMSSIEVSIRKENSKIIKDLISSKKNGILIGSFTTETITKIAFYLYSNLSATPMTTTCDFTYLQIVEGEYTDETMPDFEPYTGCQPSPSPDFPQEIKTLTGNLKLTSCGKNLFDEKVEQGSIGGSVGKTYEQCKAFSTTRIRTINLISLDINKNYTISIKNGYEYAIFSFDNEKKLYDCGISEFAVFNSKSITFKNVPNIAISIRKEDNSSITLSEMKNSDFQIEFGTTVTPYDQHIETQINANLPDGEFIGKINDTYKDTLKVEYNETDGQYHLILKKMIGKVVLDGADTGIKTISSWNTTTLNGSYQASFSNLLTKQTNSEYVVISNYFDKGLLADRVNKTNIIYTYTDGVLRIATNVATTKAGFLTWLSTHNTEVYYVLATPYVLDLGIVDTLLSYDEVTNVFSDSDLYPVINVKYYKDFEFDKILRSGYNIDEQEYEIAKKQMANGKRKRILSSYVDCIIKINLGLLDNKTYQEYKEQLDDGEFHYWSYKYNQYKKANFILTKPSITTEYAYDDDIGINDMEITLEKSSDIE